MKKEEYLKKFREYNERGVARKNYRNELDKECKELMELINKISENYKICRDKLYIEYIELTDKLEEIEQKIETTENDFIKDSEEVLSLLEKAFNDPDLYIKTNRSSFIPKEIRAISSDHTCYYSKYHYAWYDETVKTYCAFLPITNSTDALFDICDYLEERAVNCESKEEKELLKSINGEANQKEKYCLIAQVGDSIAQIGGKTVSLFYGKVPRFEMAINSLVKRESPYYIDGRAYYWHESLNNNYIKYFNSRQDLNKFLSENIIEKNIFGWSWTFLHENTNTLNTRSYKFEFNSGKYNSEYKELISKMEELK